MNKCFAVFVCLFAIGWLVTGCKPKQEVKAVEERDTVYSVFKLEKFFAYPVNERKPLFINTNKPADDSLAYNMRTQHWYLLFDTKGYEKKYGKLPNFYPENMTLEEYKKNPKPVPSEYNAIMFGD